MKDNPQPLQWHESAQYWEKHRDVIRTMFSPITDALIAEAKIVRGNTVLDVGTGPGEPALTVAAFVGPEGKVFGIDLSEGMRARARERLAKEHLIDKVELSCGDATHLPYPDGSMDAVFMSFALELFDTPEIPQVLTECKRVLRAGGRIGVVVSRAARRMRPLWKR